MRVRTTWKRVNFRGYRGMKLQLNFQIVRFQNYKQRFSDALPQKHGRMSRFGNFISPI